MTHSREVIIDSFRNERYELLNKCRWDHFLSMDIPIRRKRIFEPGAGIGDQTEWLLEQGASHIYANDGREENLAILRDRFKDDWRVSTLLGNLETCLAFHEFDFYVDLIFCYGVYYHLREDPQFTIMRQLARKGAMIAFDYLAGNDNEVSYGYDNPSASIAQYAFRPRPETVFAGLRICWEFVYTPQNPLEWIDPLAAEDRIVAVASHVELNNPNLIQI